MNIATDSKWWVLFTACLLTVMLNFDATAVNIAVPVISNDLHANLADMQWVINAFVLVSAMFQIVGGRLGDLYGPRRIYIIGTVIFVLSSLFAGIAINEETLIAARVGQGLALGIAYPMTMVLILNVFPEEKQATAMGFVMGTMGVSLAIGPTLGGVILHYIGWRWIFLINLPIGVLTVFCTYLFCSPDKINRTHQPLDYLGAVFLILSLLGIILALNQSQNWGVASPLFASVMLSGIAAGVALFYIERHRANRLVDFSLFKLVNFSLNSFIRIIAQMVFLPVLFFTPIYLQNILGYNAVVAGLVMLVCTIIIGVLSPYAGKVTDVMGEKYLTITSMLLYAIGCYLFSCLSSTKNMPLLYSALIFVGLATGINFVSTAAGALKGIETGRAGVATGVFFTIIWASCAFGIAVFGLIVAIVSKATLLAQLSEHSLVFAADKMLLLERVSKGLSPVGYLSQHFADSSVAQLSSITHAAFVSGFTEGFFVLAMLSLTGFVVGFKLKH